MKINNLTKNAIKLLRLKLIKTKIPKKNFITNYSKVENIEYRLKKVFQIIYKYHMNKKKILFLSSFFIKKIKSILKNTSHTLLTQAEWFYGKMKKSINKYNLIIVLDPFIHKNIINENYKAKIPIIILQNKTNLFELFYSYRVTGNFSFHRKKIKNNFFLSLFKTVLKRIKERKQKNLNIKRLNSQKFWSKTNKTRKW